MEGGDSGPDVVQASVSLLCNPLEGGPSHMDPFIPVIRKVLDWLRKGMTNMFDPQVVLIGPVHSKNEDLHQESERVKQFYIKHLFGGFPSDQLMDSCKRKVLPLMNNIKEYYVGVNLDNDDETAFSFCWDALFILGFSKRYSEPDDGSHSRNMPRVQAIMHDLMLAENQIPLCIIVEIFPCIISTSDPNVGLVQHLHPILSHNKLFEQDININKVSIANAPHIHDLLHQCHMPHDSSITPASRRSGIQSAVVLHKAGVNFKPNLTPQWPIEMIVQLPLFGSFCRPTLIMPVLCVNNHTMSVIMNLIAYEHQYASHKPITSYAYALGMLVKTKEDVDKLVASGILSNHMATSEEAAGKINNILKNVTVADSFYEEEWNKLNKYCDGSWTTWFRKISRRVKIVTSFFIILTFAQGVIQTIYTIKSAEKQEVNRV